MTRPAFVRSLHAEWTKFRTVPTWPIGMAAAALLLVLFALLAGLSSNQKDAPPVPVGPGGEPVTDSFYFVHRPMTGNGSITVSVPRLESRIPETPDDLRPGVVPWAKAGLIVKEGTRPGSPYAAIMTTGGHGVRMQHGYVNDTGLPGTSAHRLRLVRSGDTITGYASPDGTRWTEVGTARLRGLGPTVRAGLFVASPPAVDGLGTRGTVSTATFENLRTTQATGQWTGDQIGAESPTFAGYPPRTSGSFTETGGRFTVTGAGDIAPAVRETLPTGGTVREILTGTFAALIAVIVVGALFVTTEYDGGLIHVTLAATPKRGRSLAAKATVLGSITFAVGLAGTLVAAPLGKRLAEANGVYIFPMAPPTELRVAFGTAALLATASILALAVGTIVRNGAVAVTAVTVSIVLPYILMAVPFLPANVSNGLARVTPGAAFAVQQTLVPYDQVASLYKPSNGYYPLSPWAGFAVLAAYTIVALAVALAVLHRRDA